MRRMLVLFLTLLLALPSMASAYNVWSITKSASPSSQAGLIAPPANLAATATAGGYSTATGSSITYVTSTLSTNTATAPTTATFTVAAPPAGYTISAVNVDGVKVGSAAGTYVVNKGTKVSHTISVICATQTVTINASAVNGTISPAGTATIAYNTGKSYTITPFTGYALTDLKINNVTDATALATAQADISATGSATYTFSNVTSNQILAATFSLVERFESKIDTLPSAVYPGAIVTINGSNSINTVPADYVWSVSPSATLTPSADGKSVTFRSTNGGPAAFVVKLELKVAGVVKSTATATLNVASRTVDSVNYCLGCHNTTTPTVGVQYSAGAHGTASGHTTGTCQRCHANEGALAGASSGWTGSYSAVLVPYSSTVWRNAKPYASSNGISCNVCHNQHGGFTANNTVVGGSVVAWDPNQNAVNDQYDMCTSCHTLLNNSGAVTDMYHEKSSINITRMIADSHYDNPATGVGLASTTIEGYVIRAKSASPCADCHNVHSADLTVQEQWAKSAHAGKIAPQKDEAACTASVAWYNAAYPADPATACTDSKKIGTSTRTVLEHFQRDAAGVASYKASGVTGTSGPAWEHYNWDQTTSRGACQRCHTATGIANFLNSPATYDATGNGNDFSHLSGWTKAAGSPQNELLYCWGCHSDSQTGVLRNPGAITENYAAATTGAPVASVTYPDLGKSNVCMGCHLGREIGQTVANDTDADGVRGFINSHYLTAGATIFNKSGYEYSGQDYTGGFHKNVGMNNTYNTGDAGPCVACHMTGAEGHTFEVSAASTTCANCHGNLSQAALDASKEEFHLAMEQLRLALEAKGIFFAAANPYFFTAPYVVGGTNVSFTNWAGPYGLANWKNVMGAAFNYNMLEHDPGAYAHNRGYALKLIKDSIDFLADGVVDGQGIPAAFTAAAANKEFAEATTHPAAIEAAADAISCAACHQPAPHYGGAYGANAQFVANNGTCSDCHAAGNTAANNAILLQYAESAHGDPAGAAWKTSSSHDWPNAATCRDCHSTTGFTAKVGGTARTTVVAGAGQTLACDACHTSVETGEVRPVAQITGYYKARTFSTVSSVFRPAALAVFPNAGAANNVCIQCHAGRESGESILALADTAMSNTSFKNPHYLGAAGMMYAKLAFIDFIDRNTVIGTSTYGKSLTANEDGGLLTSTHRKLGTSAINGDSHNAAFFVPGNLDSDGPCVTCHMGGTTAGVSAADHTWDIKQVALDQVCNKCHAAEASDLAGLEFFLEEQAIPFNDAVALAIATLKTKFNISYSDAYPYFYDDNLTPAAAVKDWTRGGLLSAADAKKLHGACLNIKLMKADPAAYVHSRTYARRVLYDTIDWLDDGVVNMSTGTTAIASDPVKFVKGALANSPETTESFKYLAGYSRTTNAWNALERP